MSDKDFVEPKLAINRVYTRRGDGGQTSLVNGTRVEKDALRICAYGTVDELNAFVGAAMVTLRDCSAKHSELEQLAETLTRVQHELFNLGALLATEPEQLYEGQARILPEDVERLEREIDQFNRDLPELRSFVLPGGSRLNAELHQCRTICRRAERIVVTLGREEHVDAESIGYLNRLSDAFFVWSRWADAAVGAQEVLWSPNS